MPSLGPAEILVILVIALLVFGPDKMPDIARKAGEGYRELKRMQTHLKAELRDVVSEFDSEETGIPTPAATGDPVPMLPPLAGSDPELPTPGGAPAEPVSEAPGAPAANSPAESPASPSPPFPPSPPAEVALPPAAPPAEVALPSATPPAEHA
jgi:sec-independent protein translocase protein TatA